MHLRTTWADWLHDLRRLVHDPTRSSAIARSFARPVVPLTATGRKNQSLHAIEILYLTKHSRSVVCTSNRQKSHDQKSVRSGATKALLWYFVNNKTASASASITQNATNRSHVRTKCSNVHAASVSDQGCERYTRTCWSLLPFLPGLSTSPWQRC